MSLMSNSVSRTKVCFLLADCTTRKFMSIAMGPVMLTFVLNRGACSQDELHSALGFVNIMLSSPPPGNPKRYRLWIIGDPLGIRYTYRP